MTRTVIPAVLTLFLLSGASQAQQKTITLTIKAGDQDLKNVPVCVPLSFPKEVALHVFASLKGGQFDLYGDLTSPSLITEKINPTKPGQVRRDLHFILPSLKAGSELQMQCFIPSKKFDFGDHLGLVFSWEKDAKVTDYSNLIYGSLNSRKPMLRYMHASYDDSSTTARNKTYKVFHHLYDPSGKEFVTNGGYTDPFKDEKKLLYPHHRGLGYGFNKITYGNGKTADTWHCPPADPKKNKTENYVEHVRTLSQEGGHVLGRHRVLLDWHGSKTEIFAKEEREMTVYAVPGGTLVEFASLLKTTGGKVKLDGDPQHAGFQFRAANEVAEKTAKQTYYLRLDGKGDFGKTINWEPKNPLKETINVPWKAMSFVLGDKRYTAAYLDHPDNPKESRHSERDYGRFGCYFSWELTENNPLLVHYRIWLQDGETTGDQVAALYKAFTAPPTVTVK